jgi:hypothetical protein
VRGKKTTYEEKEMMGTLNKTRDKKPKSPDPEISEYLNKVKIMLDMLWKKLNDKELTDIELIEKYSKLFILWQKHYFTYRNLAPKIIEDEDLISKLIKEKEL